MLKKIVQPLLGWYCANHRVLPWRENRDPYRIWISEIMLQQTRVDTVIPYYERFLKELPGISVLASVDDDKLNKLWEGLGYYSRARNLKKAAAAIMERFAGKMPAEKKELLSLPGIGEYTAGAILSIAFGKPEPAVDGNVLRVIARILNSTRNISQPETKAFFAEKIKKVYPEKYASEFTQSLMELGALVCLPNGEPHCMLCPLRKDCGACQKGRIGEIPVKEQAQKRKIEQMTVLVMISNGAVALKKRPGKGLLAGLYELPHLPGHLSPDEVRERFPGTEPVPLPSHHAVFSHIEWHITACFIKTERLDGYIWAGPDELSGKYSLPSAFRPFLNVLNDTFHEI